MSKQTICPHCGSKENFHFNYNYAQKNMPVINVLCNECGECFDKSKEEQKRLITEIMEEDAKDGLYEEEDKTFKQKSKWTKVNNKQQ